MSGQHVWKMELSRTLNILLICCCCRRLPPTCCLTFLGGDVGLLHNSSAPMHAGTTCNKRVAILVALNTFSCFLRLVLRSLRLTFRQVEPVRKPSSESNDSLSQLKIQKP